MCAIVGILKTLLWICRTEQTFLPDFFIILKHPLQNYKKMLKKCFYVVVWIIYDRLELVITVPRFERVGPSSNMSGTIFHSNFLHILKRMIEAVCLEYMTIKYHEWSLQNLRRSLQIFNVNYHSWMSSISWSGRFRIIRISSNIITYLVKLPHFLTTRSRLNKAAFDRNHSLRSVAYRS